MFSIVYSWNRKNKHYNTSLLHLRGFYLREIPFTRYLGLVPFLCLRINSHSNVLFTWFSIYAVFPGKQKTRKWRRECIETSTSTYCRRSNLFYRNGVDSPLTTIWVWFCPMNTMNTSEFDETGKVCSIWTKCDCLFFSSKFVLSFASGADHQASSAIVLKQSLMSKIYTQSDFVHMLQTLPVSSISEVLIMFTREFLLHITFFLR